MKKISIELSTESVNRAIAEVRAYQVQFETALQRAFEQIRIAAEEVCQETFGPAVTVTSEPKDDGLGFSITASGRAVGFLEFGAGTASHAYHPFADDAPFDVYPGSWSEEHAQQYVELGYWVFGGRKYYFVAPRMGLFEADKYIRENARRVIKESMRGIH